MVKIEDKINNIKMNFSPLKIKDMFVQLCDVIVFLKNIVAKVETDNKEQLERIYKTLNEIRVTQEELHKEVVINRNLCNEISPRVQSTEEMIARIDEEINGRIDELEENIERNEKLTDLEESEETVSNHELTKKKILAYIDEKGKTTINELSLALEIHTEIIRRAVKSLSKKKLIRPGIRKKHQSVIYYKMEEE